MDALNRSYYMETFRKHVCPVCGFCDSELPAFCMTIYGGDPERFSEIVKHINVLRATKKDDILSDICTFEGFCGLFCNSQKQCPNKRNECRGIDKVFACYEAFADQCGGVVISKKIKAEIWKAFSGIETRRIGKGFRLPTKNPLKAMSKKQRKSLNKRIKKAKAGMRSDLQLFNINRNINSNKAKIIKKIFKKKKPIKTTFFCNEDKDWQEKIDSILEGKPLTDETSDRQPTTTT